MEIIKDLCYSDSEECLLDIYLPEVKEFSVFIYFHGGGLENGDKRDANVLAEYLVERKVAVVSANYRMYPNARFPEYIEDAAKCVSWVFSNIDRYGKCKKIYVGGSSAGAYISMLLCFDKKYLSLYGLHPTDIDGYIHDAGQPTSHFNVLREKKIEPKRVIIDDTAPLYHIGTEDKYSKMLFIVSDNDIEGRYEQTMLLKATMKSFGHKINVQVMHGNHCEYINEENSEGESVLGKIIYSCFDMWEYV